MQVLDLKGIPRTEANALTDTFITYTSTRDELEATSFLSALDMDPNTSSSIKVLSPTSSGISLPMLLNDTTGSGSNSPSLGGDAKLDGGQKREVFGDLRRFVSFAMRTNREPSQGPSG